MRVLADWRAGAWGFMSVIWRGRGAGLQLDQATAGKRYADTPRLNSALWRRSKSPASLTNHVSGPPVNDSHHLSPLIRASPQPCEWTRTPRPRRNIESHERSHAHAVDVCYLGKVHERGPEGPALCAPYFSPLTSNSFTTCCTPGIFAAARSASARCAEVSTSPFSVNTPFFALKRMC